MSAPGLRDLLLIMLVALVASGGGRFVGRQLRRVFQRGEGEGEGESAAQADSEPVRLRPVSFVVSAMAIAWLISQMLSSRAHH